MDQLRPERLRWSERLSKLETENDKVIGNSLLSAAFCTYVGGFSFIYRRQIIHNDWLLDIQERKIPIDSPFVSFHRNDKSPDVDATDSAIQNAILVTSAIRYPLCVDPYDTASDYIKSISECYKILNFCDENFMDELASAVSGGGCVIVDDVDDYIDLGLRDLLEKIVIGKCRNGKIVHLIRSQN